jgi:hypothetical protein
MPAMAGCVLRVSGTAFLVDAFLADSSLVARKVWHSGQRLQNGRPAATTSGFNAVVSDAGDLPTQVSETISFLQRHRVDLLRLCGIAEVDDLVLDFGIPQRNVAAQFEWIPSDLVRAAGEFGMSFALSLYAVGSQ